MDEHGLPIVGAGVDYTKVPALDHKNTLVYLNKFIIHTAQFLNRFSAVCEERLSELGQRIQRLNISLNILEAKLSSIPGLDEVQASSQYQPPAAVATASATPTPARGATATSGPPPPAQTRGTEPPPPAASNEPIPPPQPAPVETGTKKAKDDPLYQKYFKMKRLGVNPLQIAMEMKRHGLNPDILENEDAELPNSDGKVADAAFPTAADSSASSGSSDESEASFDSD